MNVIDACWNAREGAGDHAEESGLWGVRVHQCRAQPSEEAEEAERRRNVASGGDPARHVQGVCGHAFLPCEGP
jgi:hypothetical protein